MATPDVNENLFTSSVGTKHIAHNVLYPTGSEQEYFPMLEFGSGKSKIDEVKMIKKVLRRDKANSSRKRTT
ncbi:MAG: hypothetical protein ACFFCS_16640, partial [Candidatus Hodarchaeota archaeon]